MAGEFRAVHKDPFDRVLAAQAIVEGFGLVSEDAAMEVLGGGEGVGHSKKPLIGITHGAR